MAIENAHRFRLTRKRPDGKREVLHFVSANAVLDRLRQAVRAHGDRPSKSRYEIHESGELMLEVWHQPGSGWVDSGKWA